MTKYIPKYIRAKNAKEAYIKRLRHYWTTKNYRNFNTNIGEIYEVDFGENVGTEFSGRHLAICLRDSTPSQERMFVVPLTTKYVDYNILDEDLISTTSTLGTPIAAGVVLNEARWVSKLRIFKISKILNENPNAVVSVAKSKVDLTPEQIERWSKV